MNDILMRRLIGLLVLLALVFLLSWLLPDNGSESGEKGVPSTTLPLVAGGPYGAPSASPADSPPPAAATPPTPPAAPAAAPLAAATAPVTASTAAMPESVDAVDASAPPLPRAAPPAAKPAAVPVTPAPAPAQTAVAAAAPKSAAIAAPRPPALKLSQSLPAATKSSAAPGPSSKPMPAPPIAIPVAPRLATSVQAPPPPPPSSVSAVPQAKLWYVQIGSFSDQGNAQTTQNLLQNIGYRGESQQTAGPGGSILYRVRLGPFPSEAVAQQALDKVTHQGYPQARLLSEAAVGKH